MAAGLTIGAVWSEDPSDAYAKTLAVFWILASLCYFLVPILQRFSSAGADEATVRMLAELDGVELVATRERNGGIEVRLAPGERLVLRRRP